VRSRYLSKALDQAASFAPSPKLTRFVVAAFVMPLIRFGNGASPTCWRNNRPPSPLDVTREFAAGALWPTTSPTIKSCARAPEVLSPVVVVAMIRVSAVSRDHRKNRRHVNYSRNFDLSTTGFAALPRALQCSRSRLARSRRRALLAFRSSIKLAQATLPRSNVISTPNIMNRTASDAARKPV
jgi:hypothetical protein